MITALGIIVTVVYHTFVNAELRFEPRDSHEEYINTQRSYRPARTQNKPPVVPPGQNIQLPDDDTAEEVEP